MNMQYFVLPMCVYVYYHYENLSVLRICQCIHEHMHFCIFIRSIAFLRVSCIPFLRVSCIQITISGTHCTLPITLILGNRKCLSFFTFGLGIYVLI